MRRRAALAIGMGAAVGISSAGTVRASEAAATVDWLRQVAVEADDLLTEARYSALNRRVPELLRRMAGSARWRGVSRAEIAGTRSRLMSTWAMGLVRTGDHERAREALSAACEEAAAASSPLLSVEADRVEGVIARRGDIDGADAWFVDAAERLESETGSASRAEREASARLWVQAGYTAALSGDRGRAWDHYETAVDLWPGESDTVWVRDLDFSVYAVSLARAGGEPDRSLALADDVDTDRIRSVHQLGMFRKDEALAASETGDSGRAVAALESIDRFAPEMLCHRPWVESVVGKVLSSREGGRSRVVRRLSRDRGPA
ncbi:hypothetical protein [Salininema proteolyticum]|uniref:Tetratricopeptide repeat protein n=1 Tax=Salininema proteolyticum TaxID=1607685 RepID=A0ABV8U5P9_9ACTN